jgi:glycosyltransferase involved in cell wall biosynthesis
LKRDIPHIAIYSSNGFQETFTKAHKELLPVTYVITEGTPPRMVNGRPMLPMDKFHVAIRKIKNFFGVKIQPQEPLEYFLTHNRVNLFIAEFGMAGAAVFPLCKKHGVPLMVNFYGIDAFGYKILSEYEKPYQGMFQYASLFSVQSHSIKKSLISLGCPENKIIVNSCPPSEKFFDLKTDLKNPILIAIGRFVEKKAPDLTIRAFELVNKAIPESKLIMIGDGPLLDQSIQLAKTLQLENKIEFTGRLNQDEQLNRLKDAAVFIQHSVIASDGDAEGLPVSIMEASAAGIPVVSTRHSGVPEAVEEGVTGFLVDEKDYIKMSEHCVSLLLSIELRKKMGEKGRDKMLREFTMKIHLDRMNDSISKAMAG